MTHHDFQSLIDRLTRDIPADYLDGVADIAVSRRAVPNPKSPEVFTMGECVPLPVGTGESADDIQSRIVIYYGSFRALAQLDEEFDWEEEAWETLTHELRHHLEWRAGRADLEVTDWAAEQDFARRDGRPFDPGFYLDGDQIEPGVYAVEGDCFIDRKVSAVPEAVEFEWDGKRYRLTPPPTSTLPAYVLVRGEWGCSELVVVLRRKPSLRALLASRRQGRPFTVEVEAEPRG